MGTIISTPVTLDNLNKVYRDLRSRISKIGNIYHPQGTLTWKGLINLEKASPGDVYNLRIDEDNPGPNIYKDGKETSDLDQRFYNGVNILCNKEEGLSSKIEEANWEEYWEVLEGMLEEATTDTAGVIKLGGSDQDTEASIVSNTTSSISRGLKLSEPSSEHDYDEDSDQKKTYTFKNHQAYVDIPVASNETYGVVTNQEQTFAGAKTFNGELTVYGNLNLKQDAEVSMNSLTANTIILGNSVKITAANGIISFTPI